MSIQESAIYDLITDSAKTRFDYKAFETEFSMPDMDLNVADKVLWQILMYLAMDDQPETIALRVRNDIMLSGFFIRDTDTLAQLIINHRAGWKKEIEALKMATGMLNANFGSVEQVYRLVAELL